MYAGEHFVDHNAGRPKIGPLIHVFSASLLGTHVGHGSDPGPRTGQPGIVTPGHPEIQDLDLAAVGHHHVGRLDVAVDDSGPVRHRQAIGQLNCIVEHFADLQGTAGDLVFQRIALVIGHGDKQLLIPEIFAFQSRRANLVDDGNIWMIERRSSPCFAGQSRARPGVRHQVSGQELQRHQPIEGFVPGLVDHTHPATADRLDNRVAAHGSSGKHGLACIVTECGPEDFRPQVVKKIRRGSVGSKQGCQFRAKLVVGTSALDVCRPFFGRKQGGALEQLGKPFLPRVLCRITHRPASNSRCSQAWAIAQSRFTVLVDALIAIAVSSTVRPPKNRHSTTLACRGLIFSSRQSASSRATRLFVWVAESWAGSGSVHSSSSGSGG
jgi:hypothetical protein